MGLSNKKVDDYLYFFGGVIPGIKGYTFYDPILQGPDLSVSFNSKLSYQAAAFSITYHPIKWVSVITETHFIASNTISVSKFYSCTAS